MGPASISGGGEAGGAWTITEGFPSPLRAHSPYLVLLWGSDGSGDVGVNPLPEMRLLFCQNQPSTWEWVCFWALGSAALMGPPVPLSAGTTVFMNVAV